MGIQAGYSAVKARVLCVILLAWYALRVLFAGGGALVSLHRVLSAATEFMTAQKPCKEYVVGFLFEEQPYNNSTRVLLIKKQKPEWQAGAYNGVGGKVKDKESVHIAMAREFREEAGVYIPPHEWRLFCHMHVDNPDKSGLATVHFFTHTATQD
ncbi:hypothetical protein LCGC14_1696950, partial [marine sediment metagenome]